MARTWEWPPGAENNSYDSLQNNQNLSVLPTNPIPWASEEILAQADTFISAWWNTEQRIKLTMLKFLTHRMLDSIFLSHNVYSSLIVSNGKWTQNCFSLFFFPLLSLPPYSSLLSFPPFLSSLLSSSLLPFLLIFLKLYTA